MMPPPEVVMSESTSPAAASSGRPELRFLSLFVPDLEAARERYEAVFAVAPTTSDDVPPRHPFAAAGPVVFDLGGVKLALYQCDLRTTHPGDVGIGLLVDGPVASITNRVPPTGGQVFLGPQPVAPDDREMAVFVLPDRHFFEVLGRGE